MSSSNAKSEMPSSSNVGTAESSLMGREGGMGWRDREERKKARERERESTCTSVHLVHVTMGAMHVYLIQNILKVGFVLQRWNVFLKVQLQKKNKTKNPTNS